MPIDEFHALSDLRATLEGFGAAYAARNAGAAGMEELRAILTQLVRDVRRRKSRGYLDADTKLHETIMRMTGVPGLPDIWKMLWDRLVPFYRDGHDLSVMDWKIGVIEHEYLVEMIRLGDPAAAEEAARNHVNATCARVKSAQYKRETGAGRAADTSLHLAVMHMASHLQYPLRRGYIASNVAFISASYLSELFREHYGVGFKQHLQRLRMEKAAELLAGTRLPVATVARRVGYINGSLFSRHFTRHHDLSPRKWRKKRQGAPNPS